MKKDNTLGSTSSKKPNWWPLFVTNFLGVFNDNLLKMLIVLVGVNWLPQESKTSVASITPALLVIPFILFSPYAGRLAKMKLKQKIMYWAKVAEIPIMLIAVLAFYLQNIYIAYSAVLLMGTQSALYSPSKYGLIRDTGGNSGISFGTGMMEMLAFLGILLGTVLAAYIADDYYLSIVAFLLLIIAISGWFTSRYIKPQEPPVNLNPSDTINPIFFITQSIQWSKQYRGLGAVILGLSGFWMVGALTQINIVTYLPQVLGVEEKSSQGLVLGGAAIGIAIGSIVAGLLSKKGINFKLVFVGTIGIVLPLGYIFFFSPSYTQFFIAIFIMAFFSGFYKIPLNAWQQEHVEGRELGQALAFTNVIAFSFISLSSVISLLTLGSLGDREGSRYLFLIMMVIPIISYTIMFFYVPNMRKIFKGN